MALRKASIAVAAVWLAVVASSLAAVAQEGNSVAIDIATTDQSRFPALSAVVNVLDAKGRPVAGLDTGNFQATIDGQPATVEGLQTVVDSQVSLSVVLAVDASGSMAGEPLTAAQAAAADFVNGLSPQDSVAVLAFSDSVTVAQESTTDKTAAISALQKLTAGGNTALFEATSRATAKALESSSPRRVIILLSDGVDYGGKSIVTRDDSIAQAQAAGVPLYTLGLGADIDRTYLNDLAQATRARFLEAPTPAGLSQLYGDIAAVLRGQYVVSLQSPELDPVSPHTLELSVNVDGVLATTSKGVAAALPAAGPPLTVPELDPGGEVKNAPAATGGSGRMILFAGLLAVVLGMGGLYILRRRRPRVKRKVVAVRLKPWSNNGAVAGSISLLEEEPLPLPAHQPLEEPGGKLVVVNGPDAGREFDVGTNPLSIGSADWCDIKLADKDECIGPEEARAWVHQDKLVYHRLTRLSLLASDGATGGWLILEDGDEVHVGGFRLRFISLAPASAEQTTLNEAVNEAVQQFASHSTDPGIALAPHPPRLWPAGGPPAEQSETEESGMQSVSTGLWPADVAPVQPPEEADATPLPSTQLHPVDESCVGLGNEEEDSDPPAAASSA